MMSDKFFKVFKLNTIFSRAGIDYQRGYQQFNGKKEFTEEEKQRMAKVITEPTKKMFDLLDCKVEITPK